MRLPHKTVIVNAQGVSHMTIKDIARQAGVSTATVSRTINEPGKVAPETRQRITDIINENHFVPNSIGKTLRTARTDQILAIIPSLSNDFYPSIMKGLLDTARQASYNVLFGVTDFSEREERRFMNMLTTKQVDGVLSFYSSLPVAELNHLAAGYPYIQGCEYSEGADLTYVAIDNEQAAYDAVSYLINKGHRSIGMISSNIYTYSEKYREQGFNRAKEEHNLDTGSRYIMRANYQYDSGFDACAHLLAQPDSPTAIFAVSDTLAIGASKCCVSMGMQPGKDISIIGFDNTTFSQIYNPSISTVSQPKYEIGCVAAGALIDRISGKDTANRRILMRHDLIIRASSI